MYSYVQGAVSIRKTVLPCMAIPMLKIRRPNGRLIFNMEIAIRNKTVFILRLYESYFMVQVSKICNTYRQKVSRLRLCEMRVLNIYIYVYIYIHSYGQ